MRARTGTRIEETARLADLVETSIRSKIPSQGVNNILDNLGLPYSPMNTMHQTSGVIGANDGDIWSRLNEKHHPTADYVRRTAQQLPASFRAQLLLPACRYHYPDPQLRIAGADRHPVAKQ